MLEDTKQCPYCAETIKAQAIVCRYCGRDLLSSRSDQKRSDALALETPAKIKKRLRKRLLSTVIVGVLLTCCGVVLLPVIFSDSTTSDSSPASDASAAQRTSGNDEEGMTEELASASTETVNPTNTPQPTNTPPAELEVELISVSDYLSDNTLILYGEISNSGDLPVKEPEVRATLYDVNGGILVTESSYADLPLALSLWFTGVLYPGEKAPFSIFIDDPGEWADWEIDLVYAAADPRNFDEHCRDFLILNDTGRSINDLLFNYRISGEIENTGDKECGPVRFAITLYDADGNVVGVDTYMSDVDPFVPGDVYPFTIELFARGGVSSYSILTRAIEK